MALQPLRRQINDKPAGRKNLMINGAMNVAQRGATFTTPASGTDILDRFSVLANTNGASKVTYTQSTEAPPGFTYSLKADVVTALTPAASDYHIVKYNGFEQQDIDHLAFGTSDAQQITLSFWVKSNKTGTLVAEFQYTSVEASDASVELGKTYTINAADTWEYKTITYPAPTGHTSNQSGVASGLKIYFWLTAGSNYASGTIDPDWGVNTNRVSGQDNYLDSTSNEIYWTGFQLEAGKTATPFEHRSLSEELQLCQRYFFNPFAGGNGQSAQITGFFPVNFGTIVSTGNNGHMVFHVPFPVSMRAAPSLSHDLANTKLVSAAPGGSQVSFYYQNQGWTTKAGNGNLNTLSRNVSTNSGCVVGTYYISPGGVRYDQIAIGASNKFHFDAEL